MLDPRRERLALPVYAIVTIVLSSVVVVLIITSAFMYR